MILNSEDLDHLEKRYRTAFANSLSGFKPANLVGSRGSSGDNLAIMSSAVHLGSSPFLLALVLVDVPDAAVEEDGSVDIAAAGTVTISGLDRYHRAETLGRMPYAKPGD